MSAGADNAAPAFRWWHVIRGVEPPPAALIARLSFYPWVAVAVTCIGTFIAQLDASIVQLALPALKSAFDVSVNEVRWVAAPRADGAARPPAGKAAPRWPVLGHGPGAAAKPTRSKAV